MWSCTKSALLLFLSFSLSIAAFGQGGNFVRQIISSPVSEGGTGQPIPFGIVRICSSGSTGSPCSPLATNVYADPALSQPLSNPFAADSNGLFSVFLPTGNFVVQESAPVGAGFTYSENYLIYVNGTGSVSSVGLSMPSSVFLVQNSPVTSTGNFIVSLVNQPAGYVLANCTSGSATPTFCPLTASMLPSVFGAITTGNLTVSGNETVSGTLAVTGDTALASTLEVTGLATLGPLTATTTSLSSLGVSGNQTIGGTLNVGALSTLASLGVTGNATVGGALVATGAVSSSTSLAAPLVTSPTLNATTGYQIAGSYGLAGQCLISTGTGTAFGTGTGCGLGGTPAITAGTGAGTGPIITLLTGSTDRAGTVQVLTGSSPAAGAAFIVTLTFQDPFPTYGVCTFSPANTAAAGVAVSSEISGAGSPGLFELSVGASALAATTVYQWTYQCNGD